MSQECFRRAFVCCYAGLIKIRFTPGQQGVVGLLHVDVAEGPSWRSQDNPLSSELLETRDSTRRLRLILVNPGVGGGLCHPSAHSVWLSLSLRLARWGSGWGWRAPIHHEGPHSPVTSSLREPLGPCTISVFHWKWQNGSILIPLFISLVLADFLRKNCLSLFCLPGKTG